jgi:hypothetical protein
VQLRKLRKRLLNKVRAHLVSRLTVYINIYIVVYSLKYNGSIKLYFFPQLSAFFFLFLTSRLPLYSPSPPSRLPLCSPLLPSAQGCQPFKLSLLNSVSKMCNFWRNRSEDGLNTGCTFRRSHASNYGSIESPLKP